MTERTLKINEFDFVQPTTTSVVLNRFYDKAEERHVYNPTIILWFDYGKMEEFPIMFGTEIYAHDKYYALNLAMMLCTRFTQNVIGPFSLMNDKGELVQDITMEELNEHNQETIKADPWATQNAPTTETVH